MNQHKQALNSLKWPFRRDERFWSVMWQRWRVNRKLPKWSWGGFEGLEKGSYIPCSSSDEDDFVGLRQCFYCQTTVPGITTVTIAFSLDYTKTQKIVYTVTCTLWRPFDIWIYHHRGVNIITFSWFYTSQHAIELVRSAVFLLWC